MVGASGVRPQWHDDVDDDDGDGDGDDDDDYDDEDDGDEDNDNDDDDINQFCKLISRDICRDFRSSRIVLYRDG